MKNSGSVLIGIIAAAAAGVIIGMLIAPEKGEELRKTLKDSAGDWAKKINEFMADSKEEVKSVKSSFNEGLNEIRQESKNYKG